MKLLSIAAVLLAYAVFARAQSASETSAPDVQTGAPAVEDTTVAPAAETTNAPAASDATDAATAAPVSEDLSTAAPVAETSALPVEASTEQVTVVTGVPITPFETTLGDIITGSANGSTQAPIVVSTQGPVANATVPAALNGTTTAGSSSEESESNETPQGVALGNGLGGKPHPNGKQPKPKKNRTSRKPKKHFNLTTVVDPPQ